MDRGRRGHASSLAREMAVDRQRVLERGEELKQRLWRRAGTHQSYAPDLAGERPEPGSYLDVRSSAVPGALGSTGLVIAGSSPAYFDVRTTSSGMIPFIVRADRQSNLQVTVIRTQ